MLRRVQLLLPALLQIIVELDVGLPPGVRVLLQVLVPQAGQLLVILLLGDNVHIQKILQVSQFSLIRLLLGRRRFFTGLRLDLLPLLRISPPEGLQLLDFIGVFLVALGPEFLGQLVDPVHHRLVQVNNRLGLGLILRPQEDLMIYIVQPLLQLLHGGRALVLRRLRLFGGGTSGGPPAAPGPGALAEHAGCDAVIVLQGFSGIRQRLGRLPVLVSLSIVADAFGQVVRVGPHGLVQLRQCGKLVLCGQGGGVDGVDFVRLRRHNGVGGTLRLIQRQGVLGPLGGDVILEGSVGQQVPVGRLHQISGELWILLQQLDHGIQLQVAGFILLLLRLGQQLIGPLGLAKHAGQGRQTVRRRVGGRPGILQGLGRLRRRRIVLAVFLLQPGNLRRILLLGGRQAVILALGGNQRALSCRERRFLPRVARLYTVKLRIAFFGLLQ